MLKWGWLHWQRLIQTTLNFLYAHYHRANLRNFIFHLNIHDQCSVENLISDKVSSCISINKTQTQPSHTESTPPTKLLSIQSKKVVFKQLMILYLNLLPEKKKKGSCLTFQVSPLAFYPTSHALYSAQNCWDTLYRARRNGTLLFSIQQLTNSSWNSWQMTLTPTHKNFLQKWGVFRLVGWLFLSQQHCSTITTI